MLRNDALLYGLLILTCVGVAVGLFYLVSRLYARLTGQACGAEMCRFGFAFLPLALLAHIGHNLGHLFNGYPLIPGAIAGLFGRPPATAAAAPTSLWLWHALEIALVLLGWMVAVWSVRRICAAGKVNCARSLAAAPYLVLAVLYAALFIAVFALPMAGRV